MKQKSNPVSEILRRKQWYMPIISSTWKAEAEDYNFKSISDNIMKPCLKRSLFSKTEKSSNCHVLSLAVKLY